MKKENKSLENFNNSLREKGGKSRNLVERLVDTLRASKLKKQREKREKEMKFIDDDVKKRIVEVAENIPVDIKMIDGNTVFEISLGGKRYSIMDVNLNRHAGRYVERYGKNLYKRHGKISAHEIRGGNSEWENKKFADYVKSGEEKGFFMLSDDLIGNLLGDLGKEANLNEKDDEIAMLMYLIGIEGDYWLSMNGEDSRSHLSCGYVRRATGGNCGGDAVGHVIMFSAQ